VNEFQFHTITQGNYRTSSNSNDVFTCVLGSCIASCLFDPIEGIGGMNHFLLPAQKDGDAVSHNRFGANSMEILINKLLRNGAHKANLRAKVFGGSQVTKGYSNIGAQNVLFINEFLFEEDIPCLSKSVGGTQARRIRFWPATGEAKMLLLPDTRVDEIHAKPKPTSSVENITLF